MAGDGPTRPATDTLRIGSYLLLQPLGSGGMSSVFRARHVETGVEVAVKVLPRTLARNKTLLQRFVREARSAEALEHPNIVAIYDRGADQGRHYLVLEYVAGGDLHDWVRANGPMPLGEAIDTIRMVAEGLRFAAERGLIHRDIKPANLLRTPEGNVKIADLGLALQAEEEDERVTREGTTVGTVDYMSPEQARDSRATSVRSDIYSLGCTFFFLLTGQPPFPGGDVAEKLTRHCAAPPPDLHGFRPEAPPALNRLIHTMLAKRPEGRYADHNELIAALDAVARGLNAPDAGADVASLVPLDAILDDDGPPSDGYLPLTLPTPAPERVAPAGATGPSGFSLAELAALDGSGEQASRQAVLPPPRPAAPAAEEPEPVAAAELFEEDEPDEEAQAGMMPGQVRTASGRPMTDSERSWLTACVAIGLSLIVLVIGADIVIRSTSNNPVDLAAEDLEGDGDDGPALARIADAPVISPPIRRDPVPASRVVAKPPARPEAPASPSPPTEPVDPPPPDVAEASYPASLEARFRPAWADEPPPARLPGSFATVRRVPGPHEADAKTDLLSALDVPGGGTVEVADNGPFFIDELRTAGERRAVRARPGFRPVVALVSPRREAVRQQPAFVVLDGRSLVLEGLDLVVDARALARRHAAVFQLRGGTLTLRDCTVTVVNRGGAVFSLVQAGPSDRPSRVLFDRTFVRGALSTVVELAGSAAEVVLSRSVLVNGQGGAVSAFGPAPAVGERRVSVSRSLVATRSAAFETTAPPNAVPARLEVRALGSSFARVNGAQASPLIASIGGAAARDAVEWEGQRNLYHGWDSWMTGGTPPGVVVSGLDAARSTWAGSDEDAQALEQGWDLVAPFDAVTLDRLRTLAPARLDVLARVAAPSRYLAEKTFASFPAPSDPGFTPQATPGAVGGAVSPFDPATAPAEPPPGHDPAGNPPVNAVRDGVRDLRLDAGRSGAAGDLGRFVAAAVRPGDRLVRVTVTGAGPFYCSPLRMPEGVALEVNVVADSGGRIPWWSPAVGASGPALIEVRGASLRLNGVALARDGSARLKSLVRVDRGHMVLHRCRISSTGPVEPGGGNLLAFSAPGSLPLPHPRLPEALGAWPFDRPADRPTCRVTGSVLFSAGDVLTADVGRGLVVLGQCAVTAGRSAFVLNPGKVARSRLEADLWLDHCTVAAEANAVAVGPWDGTAPGPDRPWLVTTHRCVFYGFYQRPAQTTALLRVDPESLAHGALFWQATGDALEVPVFTATAVPLPGETGRPDVQRQWVDLWGDEHARGVTGPRAPHGSPSVRPVQRLRPGRVEAGDLFVDPTYPSDGPARRDLGADLSRLGFTPSRPPRRR